MKKIFTGILVLLSGYYAQAQTNTFPSSGNVGIGTTNPLTLFDVRLTSNEHVQFAQDLNGSSTGFSGIVCINDNNAAYTPLGFLASKYYFNVGNVGIGTANPGATLDVNGSQHLNGDLTFSNDQKAYFIHGPANGGAIRIRSNSVAASDRDVQFGMIDNNGTWYSMMTVGNNSNVGIGTTSPAAKLDVQGGNASVYNNGGPSSIVIGSAATGKTSLNFGTSADASGYGIIQSISTSGTAYGNMTINPNGGNVGIGTVNPGSYKLAVNGGIHSQSVNVDLTGWSDYVFKKDYTLPSLTQVKAYIDQNHHLPDMPSEKEVIKDGINLGEMNKLLTKKVEELTLYLIEKDHAEKESNEKIRDLQAQLNALSKKFDQLAK